MGSNSLVQLDDPLDECGVIEAGPQVPPRIWIPVAIQDSAHEILRGTQIMMRVPEFFRNLHLLRLGEVGISHPFWHDGRPRDALNTNNE